MYKTAVLLLLAIASLVLGSSSGQYLGIYNSPVNILDRGLLALPVESGIDVLSLPDLSLVDHIDVRWPRLVAMTMNNGRVAYIEEEGEGEALKIYDLKNKKSSIIKRAEKDYFHSFQVVLSDDFVGYKGREEARYAGLYLASIDGNKIFEVEKGDYAGFMDAWENLFVIKNDDRIEVYDPVKQMAVASTQIHRKGQVYWASIYGEWVVYIEASWNDDEGRDVWLWNYQTGEERLVSKGIDGRTEVDHQNDCVIYGDIVVWHKRNNASGESDPAVYSYSIGKNETRLVKKGQFSPVDLEGNTLLLRGYENGTYTYLLHDLSTGRQTDVKRP